MLNYIRTIVYNSLGEAAVGVSDFSIQAAVMEAQRAIAVLAPKELVDEIVEISPNALTSSNNRTNMYGLARRGGKAFNFSGLQLLGLQVDTVPYDANTHPDAIPVPAREVSYSEFMNRISNHNGVAFVGEDKVYCQFSGVVLTNFTPGTGYSTAYLGGGVNGAPLLATYKKDIANNPMSTGYDCRTLAVNTTGVAGSTLLTMDNKSWGADYPNDLTSFIGGVCIQSLHTIDGTPLSANKVAKIVDCYDSGTPARGVIVGDIAFNGWSSVALLVAPTNLSSLWPVSDTYLSTKWNLPTVDHALSSIWLSLGDKERSNMHMTAFVQKMSAMGVTIKETA